MVKHSIEFNGTSITELRDFPPPSPSPGSGYFYVTLNAEISLTRSTSEALDQVISSPRTRVSVDGQWILWALKRKYPNVIIEKLAGSDLIFRLADHCGETGQRLLLLGSSEKKNSAAVEALKLRCPAALINGYSPPMFDAKKSEGESVRQLIRDRIATVQPDFIICGFGTPKEEEWAWPEREWLDAHGVIGTLFLGGAIDFASGAVHRAPPAWQRVGLEGVYRVIQQPRRFVRFLKVLRLLPRLATGRY
jgi:N-acetylglucosaminyldiphosphoundecaprenol N-acetyl-beta-D-mannosaminyltransferase